MPVSIDWMGYRYRVIHANFIDHWDWSDLDQALIKSKSLLSKSNGRGTIIFDFLGSIKATTKEPGSAEQKKSPSSQIIRFVIIIDEPILAKDILKLLHEIYPNAEDILCVSSYEAAFSLVRQSLEIGEEVRA